MRPPLLLLSLLSSVLLGACTASGPPPAGTAPTPYTAAEIRRANPTGTELVHRVREHGGPWRLQTLRFVSSGSGSARVAVSTAAAGEPTPAEASTSRSSWAELRDHGAFPAERTTRVRAQVVVPAGTFDCWVYTVLGEGDTTSRFSFAVDLPGPPVRLETTSGDAEVLLMELLSVERP